MDGVERIHIEVTDGVEDPQIEEEEGDCDKRFSRLCLITHYS